MFNVIEHSTYTANVYHRSLIVSTHDTLEDAKREVDARRSRAAGNSGLSFRIVQSVEY